jgi:Flp pilus assembly protein TadG
MRAGGAIEKKERGATLIFVALVLFVLLGIAALAVDLGVMYTARTSAQHAADAAALAGAVTFVKEPMADQPDTASGAAVAVGTQNAILGVPVVSSEVLTNVDLDNRRVRVTISRPVNTFFGGVLGVTETMVRTIATAEASEVASASHCVKPIFIPNTVLAAYAGKNRDQACAGYSATMFKADRTKNAWAEGALKQNYSTPLVVRPMDPSLALEPSQYYSIDFGAGGDTYGCTISHCLNDPVCKTDPDVVQNLSVSCDPTKKLWTQNGADVGNTVKGVEELLELSGNDLFEDGPPPTYSGKVDSMQLVAMPVWDNCAEPISPGKHQFPVIGFAQVFIQGITKNGKNKGNVTGYIVGFDECGGGGPAGGTETGPFAVPVRLVQNVGN